MTRILHILANTAALATAILLLSAGFEAQAAKIKLGTLAPEDTPWHDALRDLGEDWDRLSNGKVQIQIYAGGIAGDEPDMVRKMRIGQLHAAALTGVGLGNVSREALALQLPLMFRDDAELICVRDKVRDLIEANLAKRGFVVMTWGDAGWVRFFSKVPIAKPEDLKGRKMFFWSGDDDTLAAWRDWGAEPVSMAVTDIFVGLESGLIDTVATTPLAALSYQWFPLTPHMTDLRLAPLVGAVVISKRSWDKIPKSLHASLIESAERIGGKLRAASTRYEAEAIEAMKGHGLKIVTVPESAIADWEKAARESYDPLVANLVSARMMSSVKSARDACRE